MARILFISNNLINESLGIMCLSSYLKANGHGIRLSLLSEYKRIDGFLKFIRSIKTAKKGGEIEKWQKG